MMFSVSVRIASLNVFMYYYLVGRCVLILFD